MAYHVLIHIVSLDISIFLTVISILAYKKARSNRILLTFFSFVFLVAVEILYLLQASHLVRIFYIPFIEIEFSHVLLACMIILFAWGVLKVDKKH
jgi:phosphoglycerol transferase MdoB-like AlkP superfamily enzyme